LRRDELPWFFSAVSMGKATMVHPVLAIGPRLGRTLAALGHVKIGRVGRFMGCVETERGGVEWRGWPGRAR
jgi:hypothetical protein